MKAAQETAEKWFARALQHYGAGRTSLGDHAHKRVKRLAPGGVYDCLIVGMRLIAANRVGEALVSYDRALALDPASSLAHAHRGIALFCLERDGEALQALDRALRLEPGNLLALAQKGTVFQFLGRDEEALAVSERVEAMEPDNPNALTALRVKAAVLYNLGRDEEALAAAERVVRLAPRKSFGYIAQGDILEHMERYDDALVAFERALRYMPSAATVWTRFAGVLLRLQFTRDGLLAYQQALRTGGEDPAAYNGMGVALMELERPAEALAAYDRALLLDPGLEAIRHNRNLALEALGTGEQNGQVTGAALQQQGGARSWLPAALTGAAGTLRLLHARSAARLAWMGWVAVGMLFAAIGIGAVLHLSARPVLQPVLTALLLPLELAALPLYPLALWLGWRHRRKTGFNRRVIGPFSGSGVPTRGPFASYVWREPRAPDLWLKLCRANFAGLLALATLGSLLEVAAFYGIVQPQQAGFTGTLLSAENLLVLLHVLSMVCGAFLYLSWSFVTRVRRRIALHLPAWREAAAKERE